MELTKINEKVVLVCDDLSPTEAVQLNKEYILAFVNKKEGKTSHTAILARTLGIPSAALMADYFINEVDFFSIGTNDLVQYTLAVDRMNEKVSYLYNHFNPAIIRLIKNVTQIAHSKGKYIEICGGMAEDPLAIPLLIALEIDKLSIPSGSIPKVKYIINNLETSNCKLLLNDILKLPSTKEVQLLLEDFYKNNLKY